MPGDQQPTPFASPSWEPRFALDAKAADPDVLVSALRLYAQLMAGTYGSFGPGTTYRAYRLGPSRLAVGGCDVHVPGPLHDGDLLFEHAPLPACAASVARWLHDQAAYPPKPWFDGDEARGFQLWLVPFGDDSGPYGYLVVEPKWFEVHK